MPQYTLRLHTDRLEPKSEGRLPAATRVIYVREGDAIVRSGAQAAGLAANSAWHDRDTASVTAGNAGATLLRWELVAGARAAGEAWFEAGPDPVLALASRAAPTAFVRVMILPRELKGKSSIRYVRPEDADKPRLQTYRVFVDEFIDP